MDHQSEFRSTNLTNTDLESDLVSTKVNSNAKWRNQKQDSFDNQYFKIYFYLHPSSPIQTNVIIFG